MGYVKFETTILMDIKLYMDTCLKILFFKSTIGKTEHSHMFLIHTSTFYIFFYLNHSLRGWNQNGPAGIDMYEYWIL